MTSSIFSRPPPQKPDRTLAEQKRISRICRELFPYRLDPRNGRGSRPSWTAFTHPASSRPRERTGTPRPLRGDGAVRLREPPQCQGFQPHDRLGDGGLSGPHPAAGALGNPRPEFPARLVPSPDILAQRKHGLACNAVKARVRQNLRTGSVTGQQARSSTTAGETWWLWRIGR
jgi:hypothetical protein